MPKFEVWRRQRLERWGKVIIEAPDEFAAAEKGAETDNALFKWKETQLVDQTIYDAFELGVDGKLRLSRGPDEIMRKAGIDG